MSRFPAQRLNYQDVQLHNELKGSSEEINLCFLSYKEGYKTPIIFFYENQSSAFHLHHVVVAVAHGDEWSSL